ncbi:S-adenosyl-L-methionine-dependent methyltransferase [Lepidopterella palustris CBS 459.81]|uniref:S-adenosyl-L-methionine-dependent methyltransferase n=1 Tax=Lepidopterella palustris CBS 459.81 TaxID=1314670 RepID=A0A8E2EIP0_9PEZI|nr:S-adenosyl-L-methionine-dependent methyltransferase [Lepidopterella palustris CBS 459.81]
MYDANGTVSKATDDLLALADDVVRHTQAVAKYLRVNNYAQPTFAPDSISRSETPEYVKLHSSLKQSLDNLQYLVEGPKRHFRALYCQGYELAAIQVALDFNFFTIVLAEGQISLEELAKEAGVDIDRSSRIVRLLATEFIFREPTPGYVAHNLSQYLLHVDEEIRSTLHYTSSPTIDEMLQAASSTADNVRESPHSYDSALTPFVTRHGLPIFEYYAKDSQRSIRFAKAMAGWSKLNLNINALKDAFPWGNLKGTVVDVGGSSGKDSITLAQQFPALDFIVQDSADMHAAGQKLLTDDIRGRVSFMQHSFFDPQPVGDAAAFILGTLERSFERGFEHGLRQIDLIMLVGFGGKLRTEVEFGALLKQADKRFEFAALTPRVL